MSDKLNNAVVIKVSVSGANQNLNIDKVVDFLINNPKAELGIPVSQQLCASEDSPLVVWINKLGKKLGDKNLFGRVSFHVCGSWAEQIVTTGKLPKILKDLIVYSIPGAPMIQLNVGYQKYNLNNADPTPLANLIEALRWSNMEPQVVIQANESNFEFIQKLIPLTMNFCVLYDQSHGHGQVADSYISRFTKLFQGYAGGLASKNVKQELAKVSDALAEPTYIWVDAEGNLKDPTSGNLDLEKAQAFVDAAFDYNKCSPNSYGYAFINGAEPEPDLSSLIPPAKE